MNSSNLSNKILSVKQVAEWLNVCELTIKRALYAGKLKGYKVGKIWRIDEAEVLKWIKPNKEV